MFTNVNASRRTAIDADKVRYRNIIKTDMTTIGCDYMDWSILVREIYDTESEYNFFMDVKYLENLKNLWPLGGSIAWVLYRLLIIILAKLY
jgi:hypothetical protein